MAYDIVSLPDSVVWIRYSGLINFAERMQALEAVAATTTPMAQMRLLIDFTPAKLQKEAPSARVDFTAKVVSMPLYAGARVALLGLTQEDIFPLQSAAIVRTMALRTFDDVTRAVQWLAESQV